MSDKELNLDKIVRESFFKALKENNLIEQNQQLAAEKPKFNILNFAPQLKLDAKTLTREDPKNYNSELLRRIFGKFIEKGNPKKTLENIENIFKIENKNLDEVFNALAIASLMIDVGKQNSKVAGELFETILAGLVDGINIGAEGGTIDILPSGGLSPISLKTLSPTETNFEFKQGFRNLFSNLVNGGITYIIILKQESAWALYEYNMTLDSLNPSSEKGIFAFRAKGGETYWEKLIKMYFSDRDETVVTNLLQNWNTNYQQNMQNFVNFINTNSRLSESLNINKKNIILEKQEHEFKKNVNIQEFISNSKLLGELIIDEQNFLEKYQNALKTYYDKYSTLLTPIHESLYFLNEFLLTRNFSNLEISKNQSETFIKVSDQFLKQASNISITQESLNMTREAAIVLEMLQRMEE